MTIAGFLSLDASAPAAWFSGRADVHHKPSESVAREHDTLPLLDGARSGKNGSQRADFKDAAVGCYLSRDGEVDLAPVIEACWRAGIHVVVPVIQGRNIRFAGFDEGEATIVSRLGTVEPVLPRWFAPSVVLVPLVAFDHTGARLGMGGGYYDRYLRAHPEALAIGVGHACQRVSNVPTEGRDMRLTAIVTELGWQTFG